MHRINTCCVQSAVNQSSIVAIAVVSKGFVNKVKLFVFKVNVVQFKNRNICSMVPMRKFKNK